MMQNVGQSNDNVFKVNSLEKNAEDPVLYVSENGFHQITFLFLEIDGRRIGGKNETHRYKERSFSFLHRLDSTPLHFLVLAFYRSRW